VDTLWLWNSYHGAFDRYAAEINYRADRDTFGGYFDWWLPRQKAQAVFRVTPHSPVGDSWAILAEIPYWRTPLHKGRLYVVAKVGPG
jgi:hypothetical protein